MLNTTPTDGFYRVGYQGRVGWTHGDYWTAVPGLMVNGFRVLANEETAVRWIAANTMPRLQGTLSERLTLASRVTWWSLKEGVLGLDNPHRYANCDNTIKDPLATCAPGCCWQVGIAAAQVENFPVNARYAPTRTAAIRSIGELRSILYALAPS